jgi:uncharacterized RDD family membrane protein YckC
MNCQNCDALVLPSAERCEKCGAKILHHRVVFGAPRREDFNLTREEPFELERPVDADAWQFPAASEITPATPTVETPVEPAGAPRYGGFFRRGAAFLIDWFVVIVLALVMGLMAYVGYKVGLAAHHRTITRATLMPLVLLLAASTTMLATVYFVLFHGMHGKTIGKSLLRLRVVGADHERIGYRRACLRWIGTVGFAPLLLGFLWVLWSPEKRAWHDYLARTWVIKE